MKMPIKVNIFGGDTAFISALSVLDLENPEANGQIYDNWASSVKDFPDIVNQKVWWSAQLDLYYWLITYQCLFSFFYPAPPFSVSDYLHHPVHLILCCLQFTVTTVGNHSKFISPLFQNKVDQTACHLVIIKLNLNLADFAKSSSLTN